MNQLNEKRIEVPNPYPVKKDEIIDLVERSLRLIHTITDDRTIQIYIYLDDRPEFLAEVELTSAGYVLHDDDEIYYQGSSFKEFQNDLREIVFHWEAFVSKRLKEAETTKYMACCYDPEDYYEETNYIDEDGELSCNSSGAKLFDTEDEAIEYADEIKPIGWMSFAMPFNTTLNESNDTYKAKRLKELTQAEFNRLAKRRDDFRTQTAISPAEKNNLYADIKDFEEEFRDLQDTAERLPDSYIDQVCDTASYPFEVAIDEVQDVEDWCSEAEEFLKDDISNWGIVKEANLSKKRFKETVDSTSAAFSLTKLKGYLRFETKWEYDEDFLEDTMLVDKVHEPPRFTVKWIGPEGKKHPNTYCVRIRRDTGESWNWETHYCLKASDAAEMINLEVGTWEHNNESWRFN